MKLSASMLVLFMSLLIVACGGGDSMSLEEYLTEFARIGEETEDAVDAVATPDVGSNPSVEEGKDALATYFEEIREVTEDARAEVEDLDPPGEAQDEHENFLDEIDELLDALDTYADRIADADTAEEFQAATSDTSDLDATNFSSCDDLQQLADDNRIDVDLRCDEE
jgi:ABC-type transporter Mla subunit MlaD